MSDCVLEIPVCMLQVVACAAGEPGRYALDAVLVETNDAGVVTVASDGRRLLMAEFDRGLFTGDSSVIVPAYIAKMATKLATAGRNERPMAKIEVHGDGGFLSIDTPTGVAKFDWVIQLDAAKFPNYRDVLPVWKGYSGTGVIGLGATLVADTLKAINKVIGTDATIRAYIPKTPTRPIGFEVIDDGLRVLAVVMPVAIPDWVDKPADTNAAESADEQPTLPGTQE
jgi:hypothetical protein